MFSMFNALSFLLLLSCSYIGCELKYFLWWIKRHLNQGSGYIQCAFSHIYYQVLHNEAKYLISSPEKYYLIVFVFFRFGFFLRSITGSLFHLFARLFIHCELIFFSFCIAQFLSVYLPRVLLLLILSHQKIDWIVDVDCWFLIRCLKQYYFSINWNNIEINEVRIIERIQTYTRIASIAHNNNRGLQAIPIQITNNIDSQSTMTLLLRLKMKFWVFLIAKSKTKQFQFNVVYCIYKCHYCFYHLYVWMASEPNRLKFNGRTKWLMWCNWKFFV